MCFGKDNFEKINLANYNKSMKNYPACKKLKYINVYVIEVKSVLEDYEKITHNHAPPPPTHTLMSKGKLGMRRSSQVNFPTLNCL